MLDLGTLRLGIKVDGDEAKAQLNEVGGAVTESEGKTASLMSTAKKMIKAFAAAWAVKELAKLGKAALDAYADFEQLEGGVQKIFGDDASAIVMKNAENAYKTAGISANKYMDQVTSFSASLIQSLDGDTVAAAKVADMAIQDMSDNANTFGTDIASIQNAYQGFAKQNYTMLDNLKLGYGGTKTEMERLLADAEELTGTHYDINNLNDVYEAIHAIQVETGVAGTTAKEAEKTISGSVNMMKASWENLLTSLGGGGAGLEDAINRLLESIGTVAKNIAPVALTIVKALGQAFVDAVPKVVGTLGDFMSKIADQIGKAGGKEFGTKAADLVMKLVEGLIKNVPKLVVGAAKLMLALGKALIQAAGTLIQAGKEAIDKFISGFLDAHPKIAAAVKAIGKVFDVVMTPVKLIIEAVTSAWKALMGQKGKKKFSVDAPFATAITSITDVYNKWKDVLGQIASKTFKVLKEGFVSVLDSMKSIYEKWKDILNQKSTKTYTVTQNGRVPGAQQRIGIREIPYDGYVATLHKGETVLTAAETNRYKEMLNAGGTTYNGGNLTVNVYGSDGMSVTQLASAVEKKIIESQKRRTLAWQ